MRSIRQAEMGWDERVLVFGIWIWKGRESGGKATEEEEDGDDVGLVRTHNVAKGDRL